jgi:putative membrane protein
VLFGALLWQGHRWAPALWPDVSGAGGWLHAKLGLVVVLLVYFIVSGRWLKRAEAGGPLPSPTALRWFNEAPLLPLLLVIWLVLAKPF